MLTFAAGATLVALSGSGKTKTIPDADIKAALGSVTVAVLAAPDSVRSYVLARSRPDFTAPPGSETRIVGREIETRHRLLTEDEIQTLRELVSITRRMCSER